MIIWKNLLSLIYDGTVQLFRKVIEYFCGIIVNIKLIKLLYLVWMTCLLELIFISQNIS